MLACCECGKKAKYLNAITLDALCEDCICAKTDCADCSDIEDGCCRMNLIETGEGI